MTCGIYQIRNTDNGKVYVGHSRDIEHRWKEHIRSLKGNKHGNQHLQSAWNKDGENKFLFEKLEECFEYELKEKEQHWMDYSHCYSRKKGYNICPKADQTIFAVETKKKMSKTAKDRYKNPKNHENRYNAKLTWGIVRQIRENYKNNRGEQSLLAKKYGASQDLIWKILANCIWREKNSKSLIIPKNKTTKEQAEEIRKKYQENKQLTSGQIAKEYGITSSKVSSILLNRQWVDENYIPPTDGKKRVSILRKKEGTYSTGLTWSIINNIRKDYQGGIPPRELVEKYFLSRSNIKSIVMNKTWKDSNYRQ